MHDKRAVLGSAPFDSARLDAGKKLQGRRDERRGESNGSDGKTGDSRSTTVRLRVVVGRIRLQAVVVERENRVEVESLQGGSLQRNRARQTGSEWARRGEGRDLANEGDHFGEEDDGHESGDNVVGEGSDVLDDEGAFPGQRQDDKDQTPS